MSEDSTSQLQLMAPQEELPIDSALYQLDPRITQIVPIDQIKQKVDDLSFQYTYRLCSHISLDDKQQLQVCTDKAGLNTTHDGIGRCAKHDKPVFKPRSPYTQHLKQFDTLQAIFEQFQNREKKLNDLSDEISLARSVLSLQLKDLEKDKRSRNQETFQNVLLALELVRKIGETIAKIQQTESSGITLQSVTAFLWQISEILNQELIDPVIKIRVLDRIATETSFSM